MVTRRFAPGNQNPTAPRSMPRFSPSPASNRWKHPGFTESPGPQVGLTRIPFKDESRARDYTVSTASPAHGYLRAYTTGALAAKAQHGPFRNRQPFEPDGSHSPTVLMLHEISCPGLERKSPLAVLTLTVVDSAVRGLASRGKLRPGRAAGIKPGPKPAARHALEIRGLACARSIAKAQLRRSTCSFVQGQ